MNEFLIVCLCAAWCKTCREYRPDFEALSSRFSTGVFRFLDIEDASAETEGMDFDDFPTILIFRGEHVLFYGAMPPRAEHLWRLLNAFSRQTDVESAEYATASPERSRWQRDGAIAALRRRLGDGRQDSKAI